MASTSAPSLPSALSLKPNHASPAASKTTYFLLEGLNSFATTFYIYYLYFFFQRQFGFSTKQNLLCAALSGSVYIFGSWHGGRFGQRYGYHTALKFGFTVMMLALLLGAFVPIVWVQLFVLASWSAGMSFTWPALEASVSEGHDRPTLQRMVGIYNVVWAATNALAYFSGGAILEAFGPTSSFLIPAFLHLCQLIILGWSRHSSATPEPSQNVIPPEVELSEHPHTHAKAFLRMAWLANPCAYIAMGTIIPTIPYIARKFALSPMLAGFFCSIWLFARLTAFLVLWLWPAWHYRARWLITAFVSMIGCYITLLAAPNLWLVMVAQVFFGLAVGLIYYSSLYYSMDAGDTKAEHGGLHEAAIGLGAFAGPAISASALHFFPGHVNSGTWSVGGILTAGLAILFFLSWKTKTAPAAAPATGVVPRHYNQP